MERFHPVCDARSRVSRNITIRAERLARSSSVPGMDAEDIKQELRLHLYRRDDRFDPSRGQYDTFADRVLANRIATLAAPTERLRAERGWVDFDTPSEGRGDDETLPLAVRSPCFYVGALGSRRTHAARLARLTELGHSRETLARIRLPIGLAIEAETAPEIALAIMAEIVAVRRHAKLVSPAREAA